MTQQPDFEQHEPEEWPPASPAAPPEAEPPPTLESLQAANQALRAANTALRNQLAQFTHHQEAQKKHHTLFENIDEGVAFCELVRDENGDAVDYRFLDLNPAFEHHLHLKRDAVIGRLRSEVFPPDKNALTLYAGVVAAQEPVRREYYSAALDKWFDIRIFPRGGDHFAVLFDNITQRKQTAEFLEKRVLARTAELRTARDLFQSLFHNNPLPTSLTRLEDGLFLDVNEAYLRYFGYERQEVVGRTTAELNIWVPKVERDPLVAQLREQGEIRGLEVHTAHPSGRPHTALVYIARVNMDGTEAALSAFVDITERDRMEEQMREMAAQLTMAEHEERARIALILHDDLQQQLHVLQARLKLVQAEAASLNGSEAMLQEIAGMEQGIRLATRTTRHLSVDLSPPILDGEGLVEAFGWLAGQLHEQFGLEVAVEAPAGDSFPVLQMDRRVLLFQVVRELLFNIVKHARVTETVVRLQAVDDPQVGRAYRIEVQDEGVGFDTEAVWGPGALPQSRGLLHARERLRLIGGRLEVKSIPGDGTQVVIVAPVRI